MDLPWLCYPLRPSEVGSKCPPSQEGPDAGQSLAARLCPGQGAAGSRGFPVLTVPSADLQLCISYTRETCVPPHSLSGFI